MTKPDFLPTQDHRAPLNGQIIRAFSAYDRACNAAGLVPDTAEETMLEHIDFAAHFYPEIADLLLYREETLTCLRLMRIFAFEDKLGGKNTPAPLHMARLERHLQRKYAAVVEELWECYMIFIAT